MTAGVRKNNATFWGSCASGGALAVSHTSAMWKQMNVSQRILFITANVLIVAQLVILVVGGPFIPGIVIAAVVLFFINLAISMRRKGEDKAP